MIKAILVGLFKAVGVDKEVSLDQVVLGLNPTLFTRTNHPHFLVLALN